MGAKTDIEYVDSTLNLMQGCDGCELWTNTVKTCYALRMLSINSQRSPYPTDPVIHKNRLASFLALPKLDGASRKDKPWLNGLPRVTFLNDMGDQHTQSLDLMWMKNAIVPLTNKGGIYICLTKRPRRAQQFWSNMGGVPEGFWLLTSVTNQDSVVRIRPLLGIKERYENTTIGLSLEPLIGYPDISPYIKYLDWVIVGGESGGIRSRPTKTEWFEKIVDICQKFSIPVFVKQFGYHISEKEVWKDKKGGDWGEWGKSFDHLKIREMPKWTDNKPLYESTTLF